MTVRVGIIGVGGMGACHARHVAELAGAELEWIADPYEKAGAALAADLGCDWVAEAMDRIGPEAGALVDCDAVVVASPDRFHHRYVMAGLQRGLPILAEKPLTVELVAVLEFDDIATGYEVSVEVTAEGGNVVAAEPLRAAVRADGMVTGEIGDDWFTPFLDTYRVEMRDFLSSVEAGEARGPSAWDGYAAQAVVEAAAVSAATDGVPTAVELPVMPALYSPVKEREAFS